MNVNDDYIDPNQQTLCYKGVPSWVSSGMMLSATNGAVAYFSDPLRMSEF